jgi:hypothetical protein
MDGESIDLGCDTHRHVGGDPEPNLLLELKWGSHGGSRAGSREGSRPGGSGFSMANKASAQVSIQSRGTYRVPSIFKENPPNLVQSLLWAITLMTLLGVLVGWFWLGRLFAQRVNVETKDCATIVGITQLPQLTFQSSLVRRSIFVPRTWMASYPTNIRTFNPSM